MGVLTGLQPERVFYYFEEIAGIPHGSYHTEAISNYLVQFAEAHGLKCRKDSADNVIIWKPAAPGYEASPVVMLQGHIDMVCDQAEDCKKDMEKEGLDLFIEGDTIGARGTTLGGDDGIAVAIALAVLESDTIAHGPLECLFTANEEVGLLGASALDASDLKAQYMLNIDSEEDRVLTVSCAGSTRIVCTLPVQREAFQGDALVLTVDGLIGGHSGEEIHKGRANANILMGRALHAITKVTALRIAELKGGVKDNAIPHFAKAVILVEDREAAFEAIQELSLGVRGEYRVTDPDIVISLEEGEAKEALDRESTRRLITFMFCSPNGVQQMSAEVPGLVQTSINLGQVSLKETEAELRLMSRSSVNSQKEEVTEKVINLCERLGGTVDIPASYSAWEYKADSRLREVMIEAFREVYREEPKVAALHAGLECGIISGKLPGLDCISYGPDLKDIHTHRERLYIASTERIWKLTLETLKRLK